MGKKQIIYACENRSCGFIFTSQDVDVKQCPDCGKWTVRPANKKEIEEYKKRMQCLIKSENY